MDEDAKSLLGRIKKTPTSSLYLQLANLYKQHSKFFSAQVTLQEAFDTLKPSVSPVLQSDLLSMLEEMPVILGDEYLPITKPPSNEFFIISSLLSELHLLQGHVVDALKQVMYAVKCYGGSEVGEKVFWRVTVCVLLEVWLKFVYVFLYRKKFEKAVQCYGHLERLGQWLQTQPFQPSERLHSLLGTVHLSRHFVLKDPTALDQAGHYFSSVTSGESLLCYLYLRQDTRASQVIRDLLESYSTEAKYWIWLGLIEKNGAAVRQALSLDPRNWYCWAALAYLQYHSGAYEEACYSLQIAYKLDYKDYRLPLLRSLLARDLGQIDQCAELVAFAADLEPPLGLYQVLPPS